MLNVALVGYGYAGKVFHAPLIMATEGLRLATVVSSDPAKVHADISDVRVVPTVDDALADASLNLVVIASPNTTHFSTALSALRAGKHVVVDKPLCPTLQEAKELFDQSEKSKLLLTVFQNRRWDSDFLTLKQLIATGVLGEITYFQSNFDRFRPEVKSRWREQALPGSGLWYDLGSHLTDQAIALFGAPDTVTADLEIQRKGGQSTDYFHVVLTYGNRRVVLHGSTLVCGGSPRFTIHGRTGSYVKYGLDTQEDALKAGARPTIPDWGHDPNQGTLTTAAGDGTKTESIKSLPGNYVGYFEAVRDAIEKKANPPVTKSEALLVMRILELAQESNGHRLALN